MLLAPQMVGWLINVEKKD